MNSGTIRKHLTDVRVKQVGRKFCTSCQRESDVADGKNHRMANGKTRFVCGPCVRRMDAMRRLT